MSTPRQFVFTVAAQSTPAWYQNLTPLVWTQIGGTFNASGVKANVGGKSSNNVLDAWGGAVLNTQGLYYVRSQNSGVVTPTYTAGAWMVFHGGGHGDYAGNELYAFGPLGSDTKQWVRVTDPYLGYVDGAFWTDGYPASTHTYDHLTYVEIQNRMYLSMMVGPYPAVTSSARGGYFDFSVDPSLANPWTELPTPSATFGEAVSNSVTAYNGADHINIMVNGSSTGQVWRRNIQTGVMSRVFPNCGGNIAGAVGDYDPVRSIMVRWRSLLQAGDFRNPTAPVWYTPSLSSALPTGTGSIVYSPTLGAFILYRGNGGNPIYKITPSDSPYSGGTPWTVETITTTGFVPVNTGNGVYSKFQYVPAPTEGFVIVVSANDPVMFLRLS